MLIVQQDMINKDLTKSTANITDIKVQDNKMQEVTKIPVFPNRLLSRAGLECRAEVTGRQ